MRRVHALIVAMLMVVGGLVGATPAAVLQLGPPR